MSSSIGYVQTPNLGLYKPVYMADLEMWGNHLNRNADTLDALLSTTAGGAFVPIAGGTMVGSLVLNADPTSNLQAATKQYVDAHSGTGGGTGYLPLAGGALTGPLTLAADPAAALQPVTLQYYNAHVPTATASTYLAKAGGVMTGTLTLAGNATANLSPTTLQQMNAAITAGTSGYLPLAGGQMTGPIQPTTSGSPHAVLENNPTMDFRGGNISFYRQITNATSNEAGANPKVYIQLDNNCANYTVQPWGGYDGPTALFVNATNWPNAAGSVVATWSQITSQGNHPYQTQDTAHYIRVIKTGQNSCWGIAIQHQDNTGLVPGAFATMGIENAAQINGPEPDAHVQYDATYSMRQLMSFIPSVNPTGTWAASQTWPKGTLIHATPSGGVSTIYIAQNNGTTGGTQPTWPTTGNVTDGTITWTTGVAEACELGVGILMGGGRPQLPNTLIWTGIAFNATFGNACIDTTLAGMSNPNAAAIRLSQEQIIDFTGGGGSLANQNRRYMGYHGSTSGVTITTPGGGTTVEDNGGLTTTGRLRVSGNVNWSGVTTGYSDTYLSIGRNAQGLNNINFVTGSGGLTLFSTNGSGVISAPYASFGAGGNSFSGLLTVPSLHVGANQVVGARVLGWGTPTGATRTGNFSGATATLAQTSATLAQLIIDLEAHGLLA